LVVTPDQEDDTRRPRDFDVSVAHPARVYNYWLGGKDNFAADREAGDRVIAAQPGIVAGVRANRAFLRRAVRFLTEQAGIRQFLDIGTGIPTRDNTHEVAQAVAPESRVVYVDNDPLVLSHVRALLTSKTGVTAYIDADLRDTGRILADAARTLDFSQPVAVMLLLIMQFIPDSEDPYGIVTELMRAVAPGSYLVLSQPARDIDAEAGEEAVRRYNEQVSTRQTHRTLAEISRFFEHLELVPPGVVPLNQWRPAEADSGPPTPAYCGIGRKIMQA
jgi:SAM-dependent methyltransferase